MAVSNKEAINPEPSSTIPRSFSMREFIREVGGQVAKITRIVKTPSTQRGGVMRIGRRTILRGVVASVGTAILEGATGGITNHVSDLAEAAGPENDSNFPVPGGRFFTETNENAGPSKGFFLTDGDGVRFFSEFNRLGGIQAVGYPASRRFEWDGFTCQVMQRVVFQWRPEKGRVDFINVFDLYTPKQNQVLLEKYQIPLPRKFNEDGLDWAQREKIHLAVMERFPVIKRKYHAVVGDAVQANGLPTSDVQDMGAFYALRCQRVVIQQWKDGREPTVVLGGDIAKEMSLIPASAKLVEDINSSSGNGIVESQKLPYDSARNAETQASIPSNELLSQLEYLQQIRSYIESSGRKGFVEQFRGKMLGVAQSLKVGLGRIIPSTKYPQYTFARDGFWALMTLQDKGFTQQVVDRFVADQAKNPDGHFATALLHDDSIPVKRDRDEESTMMLILEQFLLHKLGGNVDTNSLSRAYAFVQEHLQNGEYVTNGDKHPEDAGTYHYWADTLKNPPGSVITYNQGLLCVTLRALKEMGVPINDNLIAQAENNYRNLANPQNSAVLPQRKGSTNIDVSAFVGEGLSLYWFDRSILGTDKVLATYNHVTNNPTKVTKYNGRFIGFKVLSDFLGRFLSQDLFNDENDTPGSYQNGGTWPLYDELLLYAAIRHGAGNQAKELFLQRLESEGFESNEFMFTTPGREGTVDLTRKDYGWNTAVVNLRP